jgi:predicted ABC-class ATPase
MNLADFKPTKWERILRRRTKLFAKGYEKGSRDTSEEVRERIIRALIEDAVISTNLDTDTLEHIVQIVEES